MIVNINNLDTAKNNVGYRYNIKHQSNIYSFPFLLFVSLASFFSAILNSHNNFAAAAAAPIILNILLIIILLFGNDLDDQLVFYLSYVVTLAGLLQLFFLIYYARKFYIPKFSLKININSKVKLFFKKLLPSIFSSGVTQINILVGTIIASFQVLSLLCRQNLSN